MPHLERPDGRTPNECEDRQNLERGVDGPDLDTGCVRRGRGNLVLSRAFDAGFLASAFVTGCVLGPDQSGSMTHTSYSGKQAKFGSVQRTLDASVSYGRDRGIVLPDAAIIGLLDGISMPVVDGSGGRCL